MLATDTRSPLQKLRRSQLYQLADEYGISYPKDAPATVLRPILEAANIDPTQPLPISKEELMAVVSVAMEDGSHKQVLAAKQKVHATKRIGVDSTEILNQRVEELAKKELEEVEKEKEALEDKVAKLEKLVLQLTEAASPPSVIKKDNVTELPTNILKFKKYCREKGVKVLPTDKRADLEKKLEALDGTIKNPA